MLKARSARSLVGGFVLPIAVILVLVLTISGTGFLQHDYLERRSVSNEISNHSAFYLANAGIERARNAYEIDTTGGPSSWNPVLAGGVYPLDVPGHPLLCVQGRNCVMPPFPDPSSFPDIPFDDDFREGEYRVRVFNDGAPGETSTSDSNGVLVMRALGEVNGEEKLLEVLVQAISGLKLVNCGYPDNTTPPAECPHERADVGLTHMPGRAPASRPSSILPTVNWSFYQNSTGALPFANLPWIQRWESPTPGSNGVVSLETLTDNTYYYSSAPIEIVKDATADHVVVFSEQNVEVRQAGNLTNTMIIGMQRVELRRAYALSAPAPAAQGAYPAVISGGTVEVRQLPSIVGPIYSTGEIEVRLGQTSEGSDPVNIEGVLITYSGEVSLRREAHISDGNKFIYYGFMPGFVYPDDEKTAVQIPGSWRELR